MVRLVVLRAMAIAAFFAVVWLAPLRASAAILPVCEDDPSSGPPSSRHVMEAEADCVSLAQPALVEEGDPQVAPMCDLRGASVLAPGRIYPMTDARIDAVVSCDGTSFGPAVGPSQGDQGPAHAPWAIIEPAIMAEPLTLHVPLSCELAAYPTAAGAPRAGFRRGIEHPPRG
jgi:hypothetical protein